MKILSRLRIKAEENWFDTLTDEQKKAYIEEHPDSKYAKNYRPSSPVNKAPMKGKPKAAPKKADDFESYIKGENKDYYEGVIDKIQYMAEDDGFDAVDSESLMDNLYNGAMYQISDAGYDYDDAVDAAKNWMKLKEQDGFIRDNFENLKNYAAGKKAGPLVPAKKKPALPEPDPKDLKGYINHPNNKEFFEDLRWKFEDTEDMSDEDLMQSLYSNAMGSMSVSGYDYDDADYAASFMYNLDKNDDFIRKNLKTLRKMFATEE